MNMIYSLHLNYEIKIISDKGAIQLWSKNYEIKINFTQSKNFILLWMIIDEPSFHTSLTEVTEHNFITLIYTLPDLTE